MKKLLIAICLCATPASAADYVYRDAPPPVIAVQPPPLVVAPQPRCRVIRETKHDDILDTNDYTEHEECDED